ncbi:DegQ family serine endoprotease [Chromobacterium sp. IIBBL 290-4]|uniref:DegQ family serine endoprotease n=1 Tax=Chromobacterium sp. IIBBL 290-4 TaxID=2953890 RepID=UPI0020B72D15|nr:DegQ family serine endoprotease [Chromobacterium sp. IIBBL 290-4]UTH76790.1 DegQ family serine endoprotease [Chromobacterium sp. IIBBL 290-4]
MAGALLAASLLSGCDRIEQLVKGSSQPAPVAIPAQNNGQVAMLLPDFTQLVSRDGPSVVNIQASRENASPQQQSSMPFPVPEDDPLYDFFRRFMPNQPQQQDQAPEESVSYGSGFIISSDGFILTNAHVVADGGQIRVTLTDKRELRAKLVGLDKRSDVALLKVAAADLPVAKIGNPSDLKVGEWVAAIGAPFGFDNTVTAGIVSAKGRSLPDETLVPFIQTDVAINPGNSGGPLFNLRGEVVGINSQIYSRSGGFMGISFAIPIDLAMQVADQLKTKGKVSRGQLGINIQEVTQELAQSFGLQRPSGALVVRVDPKGPAARAGLQAGDIILKLNNQVIDSSKDLPMLVGALGPGTKIKLMVWRKGIEKTLEATLAEQPDNTGSAKPANDSAPQGYQFGKLGLTLSELTQEQRADLGIRGGLLIQRSQGPAARSGLQAGDIIVGLNQSDVTSIKAFEKALADAGGHAALLVRRGESVLFIALRTD